MNNFLKTTFPKSLLTVIFVVLAAIIIISLIIVLVGLFSDRSLTEAQVRSQIAAANYCAAKSDCQGVSSICPFGCHVAVNKAEATRINKLLKKYETKCNKDDECYICNYKCWPFVGYDCTDNKCQVQAGPGGSELKTETIEDDAEVIDTASAKTPEQFKADCLQNGGRYSEHSYCGIVCGRYADCTYGSAPDGNRLCSSNDPADNLSNTCADCSLGKSCGVAAGDFGPERCHCKSYTRLERLTLLTSEPTEVLPGWQTYRNEKFGFEFRYPEGWVVSNKINEIFKDWYSEEREGVQTTLVKAEREQYYIDQLKNYSVEKSTGKHIDLIGEKGDYIEIRTFFHHPWNEFIENDYEDDGFGIENIEEKEITGIPVKIGKAIRKYEGTKDEIIALFKTPHEIPDSVSVSISFNNGNYEKDVFDGLISTFKFIEPIDTSNWQTYRNEEFGFELSYPLKVSIAEINNPLGISIHEGWADKNFEILVDYDWENRIQELEDAYGLVLQETFEIDKLPGEKFTINLPHNSCTISYLLIERGPGQNFFFSNLVACPTHPSGVDAQMFDIVKTFKIF